MQVIKKLVKNIMQECIQDEPSWMAVRSCYNEILRLIDDKNRKKE